MFDNTMDALNLSTVSFNVNNDSNKKNAVSAFIYMEVQHVVKFRSSYVSLSRSNWK